MTRRATPKEKPLQYWDLEQQALVKRQPGYARLQRAKADAARRLPKKGADRG